MRDSTRNSPFNILQRVSWELEDSMLNTGVALVQQKSKFHYNIKDWKNLLDTDIESTLSITSQSGGWYELLTVKHHRAKYYPLTITTQLSGTHYICESHDDYMATLKSIFSSKPMKDFISNIMYDYCTSKLQIPQPI